MPVIKYIAQEDDEFEEFETDDWDIRKEDQTDVKVSHYRREWGEGEGVGTNLLMLFKKFI